MRESGSQPASQASRVTGTADGPRTIAVEPVLARRGLGRLHNVGDDARRPAHLARECLVGRADVARHAKGDGRAPLGARLGRGERALEAGVGAEDEVDLGALGGVDTAVRRSADNEEKKGRGAGWLDKEGRRGARVRMCVHERTRAPRDACPPACPPHRGEAWRRTAYEAILARRGSAGGDPPRAGEASGEDGPPPPSRPAADGLGCIGGTPPAVVPAGPSDGRGPAGEGGAGDDDGEGTPDDEAPAPRQLPRLGPGGRGSREGGQAAGRQDPCLRDGI